MEMEFLDAVRLLEEFAGLEARVSIRGVSDDGAALVMVVGIVERVPEPDIPPWLAERVEKPGVSFQIGDEKNVMTLWPDRFVRAEKDELGVLELVTMDGILRVEREKLPWT